ncbi:MULTISPECIES: phosphonate ABC transporter, permease protein PhnE [Bacillus]|jgi:phosphonate transport system permease protein|uniref:Phosphonate ABC transporter, permease protein n=1 Tax=Bacillus cereus (strain B4264) TaxID=405532 RepID=B7HCG3_BACC4|nr:MULTISPECIES: phosphonate ABC transporter, permease protein PhnE [Bacillus]MCO4218602.1 phosphonate ABC transporter, permease protein PhnE [Bacillus sp. 10017]MRC95894.1 phosphonate ABC transporter, permease protein PhnE [Bacillus thuringiensis]CGF89294.1 glycine betaine transport system permease [Streptococcus pneumoniae]ACK61328.1 phosphonate ABC transporter, permease protein [Bacillus cereus B4264]KAA0765909.1 phosphonate ABC transporter, permease protein PhnE [Bacillus sp. TE8-1]
MNDVTIYSKSIPKPPSKLKHMLTFILVILLLWGSSIQVDASFSKLVVGFPNIMDLLKEMVPPDWSYFQVITTAMLDTIRMAIIGTTLGAILAIPLALFAASNVFTSTFLYSPARLILNFIRTIPDLLLAAIFVAIFGIGPLPGILALTFFSIGLVAKLLYESIESIDPGPLEAMTAVGANKVQWIVYGVIPQVKAHFVSYVLYTFEVNVRAAAVLGLVGAGGIGLYYDRTLGFLQYQQTASIIIYTLVVVLVIDYVSTLLREKL